MTNRGIFWKASPGASARSWTCCTGTGRPTVAEVLERIAEPPGYSAVRALLRTLETKGHVRHREEGPRYVFEPVAAKAEARSAALSHLVETFFEGSTRAAVAALLGSEAHLEGAPRRHPSADRPGAPGGPVGGARNGRVLPELFDWRSARGCRALAVKSTLVLAFAWTIDRFLVRAPAASRHLLWAAGLAGLLVLPAAELLLPAFSLPILPAPAGAPGGAAPRLPAGGLWPRPAGRSWARPSSCCGPPAGWLRGGRVCGRGPVAFDDPGLLADLRGRRRPGSVSRTGRSFAGRVAGLPGPCVAGGWRPFVILPEEASRWDGERRRLVLGHELAHLARRDLGWQALAQLAVALAFFHPLAWLAQRRLRAAGEQACDDQVLRLGAKPSSYAAALLAAAGVPRKRCCAPPLSADRASSKGACWRFSSLGSGAGSPAAGPGLWRP